MKIAGLEGDRHPGTPHHVHVKALDYWFTFWGLSRQIHGKFHQMFSLRILVIKELYTSRLPFGRPRFQHVWLVNFS